MATCNGLMEAWGTKGIKVCVRTSDGVVLKYKIKGGKVVPLYMVDEQGSKIFYTKYDGPWYKNILHLSDLVFYDKMNREFLRLNDDILIISNKEYSINFEYHKKFRYFCTENFEFCLGTYGSPIALFICNSEYLFPTIALVSKWLQEKLYRYNSS